MLRLVVALVAALAGSAAADEERSFRLRADPEIAASGLLDYLQPRFTLKTGRRIERVEDAPDVDFAAVARGPALIAREGRRFGLTNVTGSEAGAMFADWLASDAGMAAVAAFVPEDGAAFTAATAGEGATAAAFEGDAALGRTVSEAECVRCHRVSPEGRGIGIASSPSFMALRALPDWEERFQTFYVRNPHPAFLRIDGISPDFDPARPPPIAPVLLRADDVEAILAYVAALAPADLGAPVVHQ